MKKRTLSKGVLRMPNPESCARHVDKGFTLIQAYVRAFNEANNLRHTAFELMPAEQERMAA